MTSGRGWQEVVETPTTRRIIPEMAVVGSLKRIDCLFVSDLALLVSKASCLVLRDYSIAGFVANWQEHRRCVHDQAPGWLETIQLKI